jgi:hypothetical protein
MGRHELSSPTVLSPGVARFSKGFANSNVKAEANNHRPGATEPPLPLTPQRLELIKAYAKDPLRNADGPTASRIAQRFAPRAPAAPPTVDHRAGARTPLTAPLSALNSGIRTLTAVLVVVALLPNLTLAAFWLHMVDMPWLERVALPPNGSAMPAVQSAGPPPVLSAPNTLEASAGEDVSFPIALDGTDGVPAHSIIVIRGLPQGSTLSNGYAHGATEWNLKPDEIGDLHLVLPDVAIGESKLAIQLAASDGHIIADTATILKMMANPKVNAGAFGIKPQLGEAQVSDKRAQEIEAGVEERTATLDAASLGFDPVPLPTRRPAPAGIDDDANWIKPSAFVNLREGPSSSASVVDVVAKGAKLRVIGRKRGWVQVSNPATSRSGWIYAGNVDTVR